MRRRIAVTTLAASAVIAAAAPSALAIPGSPGGAAAPAGPAAQVRPQRAPSQARKASPERPLIGELALPAQIAPGRPPKVVVMAQVVWRSVWRASVNAELWNGNRESAANWLDAEHPIRWAWRTFERRRIDYEARMVHPDYAHLRFHRLRTRSAIRAFLSGS